MKTEITKFLMEMVEVHVTLSEDHIKAAIHNLERHGKKVTKISIANLLRAEAWEGLEMFSDNENRGELL